MGSPATISNGIIKIRGVAFRNKVQWVVGLCVTLGNLLCSAWEYCGPQRPYCPLRVDHVDGSGIEQIAKRLCDAHTAVAACAHHCELQATDTGTPVKFRKMVNNPVWHHCQRCSWRNFDLEYGGTMTL
jgi:hypothetical protein